MRYIWNYSSNAFLEIQWYLFSAIFLFGAGYTLMRNEHVRIDLISGRLSARGRAWIDIFGIIFFSCRWPLRVMYLSWPIFLLALANNEQSSNAGGLTVWPVRLLVPVGFFLLVIQGISELIKRIGFCRGVVLTPGERAQADSRRRTRAGHQGSEGRTVMAEFMIANMAPIIFVSMVLFPARRFSGVFRAGGQRHLLRSRRYRTRSARAHNCFRRCPTASSAS
jgi:TRAP-type mannitol/chloroaromatic compound transport system permease small subunit